MAGDWIPVDHELPEKPEVIGIAERTSCDRPTILGRLLLFWRLADSQTTDGQLTHVSIKGLCQICGGDEEFWHAVEAVGWLEVRPEGVAVPRFETRFSKSAKRRKLGTARKQVDRVADRLRTNCGQSDYPVPVPVSEIPGSGVFKSISDDVLRDTGRLRRWLEQQAAGPSPVLSVSDLDWLRAVAAAEHSLAKGKRPVALFASTVGGRKWERISNAAEDRARDRIRAWESSRPAAGGVPLPDLGAGRD